MSVTQGLSDARASYSRWQSPAVGGLFSLVTRELFRFEDLGLGKGHRQGLSIGASSKCDIVLCDPFVSAIHAGVVWHEGALYILDLKSRNGVFQVEHRRAQKVPGVELALGQRFVLGRTTLVCVTEAGHAPLTAFDANELASLSHDLLADRRPTPPPRGIVHELQLWASRRNRPT